MIPCQYSECVSLAQVPAHQQQSCASFCDVESANRCKTGVSFGPGLAPSCYRDAIIVYVNSTRRRYISRVEYTIKMKPKSYSETNYMRPKHVSRSFVAFYDHHGDETRRWYKTSVQLKPKTFTSSEVPITSSTNVSEESGIDMEAGDESMEYSECNRMGDTPSPLRSPGRGQSQAPWGNAGNEGIRKAGIYTYSKGPVDSNANKVITHRSGPFIYNAPKERYRRYNDIYDEGTVSGARGAHTLANGYGHDVVDDTVEL